MNRFRLFHVSMKYVRDLSKVDDNVASVSPQTGKQNRPFVGIIVVSGGRKYCVPLASPKAKHEKMKNAKDFMKIYDRSGKFIGVLNFNNMIPVSEDLIQPIEIEPRRGDNPEILARKGLLQDQLRWCNLNADAISKRANKLYRLTTENPDQAGSLLKRCCDFKKLEEVLDKRAQSADA